ncbi:Uncharacterized protein pbN1_16940 [Aromatoleum bremense]|nr:Uncharacterized protein pbN1_16940 [Aromatoleum bremense]
MNKSAVVIACVVVPTAGSALAGDPATINRWKIP